MFLERLQVGPLASNCYIIADEKNKIAAIIDTGGDSDKILNVITREQFTVEYIFLTHGHGDHIAALQEVKNATNAKAVIHEQDAALLSSPQNNLSIYMGEGFTQPSADIKLKGNEKFKVGDLTLEIMHTPGHTPGGISIKVNDAVFTGDTLFAGSIGRTDLPGGSYDELISSIKEKLLPLGDDISIFPGHGDSSTLGYEKNVNPFLR